MVGAMHTKTAHIYSELRPRKSRSKAGCLPCRTRRKKCDESQPTCQSCVRLQLRCTWPTNTLRGESRTATASKSPSDTQLAQSADQMSTSDVRCNKTSGMRVEGIDADDMLEGVLLKDLQLLTAQFRESGGSSHHGPLPAGARDQLFRTKGAEGLMLVDHFCCKTAPWLVNGHDYDNPVLRFIVPLAMTDPMVLSTVMAISGTHLHYTLPSVAGLALKYYSAALLTLQDRLTKWTSGLDYGYQPILATMILLCHCEVISGNTYGAALQHLRACEQFIDVALLHLYDAQHQDFAVFLIEHFGYFILMANLRCSLQESNTRLGLRFSCSILPVIKNMAGFGSIFAFEPEAIALIPEVAQLAWERSKEQSNGNTQTWQNTYSDLLHKLRAGQTSVLISSSAALEEVYSIKANALLMLTHETFHESEDDLAALDAIIQPLMDHTMRLLAEVDETDFCHGLYWALLLIGTYTANPEHQRLLVHKLKSNQSNMPFFAKGIELLRWLWNEGAYGLAGLERTAVDHGVELSIC